MTSLYRYILGGGGGGDSSATNGSATTQQNSHSNGNGITNDGRLPTETTSLLDSTTVALNPEENTSVANASVISIAAQQQQQQHETERADAVIPLNHKETNCNNISPAAQPRLSSCYISAQEFYFANNNPTLQRYYRFTTTKATPVAALYKRPGPADVSSPLLSSDEVANSGVTGLLRRSAVVPSHGTNETGDWILVSVGGRSGWARKQQQSHSQQQQQHNLASQCSRVPHNHHHRLSITAAAGFAPATTFVASEAWMGNHTFLCHGKWMLGSDAGSLFITNAMLIVGTILHQALVLPELRRINSQKTLESPLWLLGNDTVMLYCSLLLIVCCMTSLWRTALMDPGILPYVSSPLKPPVPPEVVLGGPLGYRYCSTCNLFRPPRSKHCNSCNVCVMEFDHHCPWTGNCVGLRNRASFLFFLLSVTLYTLLVTAACVRLLVFDYQIYCVLGDLGTLKAATKNLERAANYGQHTSHCLGETMLYNPIVTLFGLFCALCTWSLVSLVAYHAVLISVAQTTNERVRGVYQYAHAQNPADRGCCRNWWTFATRSIPPSHLPWFDEIVVGNNENDEVEAVWPGEISELHASESNTSLAGVV